MAKIVDRVFVYDDRVIALALHSDFGIILNVPQSAPDQVLAAVTESTKKTRKIEQSSVPKAGATGLVRSLGTPSNLCLVPA